MNLEDTLGNLRDAYQQIQSDTMLHVDEITNRRRVDQKSRNLWFYPADGHLYTVDKEGRALWGITRRPQNLVLTHINEAYAQLTAKKNYIPDAEEALGCFSDVNTTVIDLNELKLGEICGESGYFIVDPRNPNELNPMQKIVAMRIFGPDQDNYAQNLKMFAEVGKTPHVFALMPGYVKNCLRQSRAQYLARASCLAYFGYNSNFNAGWRTISDSSIYVRGVRATSNGKEASIESSAQKNGKLKK